MTIAEFIAAFERIVPQGARHGNDNTGMHTGDARDEIKGILVAHEMDVSIVDEVVKKQCNFVLCYHPLVFTPLQRVVADDPVGLILLRLAEKRIALFVVHTNFDSVPGGTSFLLADKLGLHNCRFLAPLAQSIVKIAVYAPPESLEAIAGAMWDAGAGTIGDYNDCSFHTEGIGTFRGNDSANPAIGKKNVGERVNETRLEMTSPRWRLKAVLRALIAAHPYEEPAYDVFPAENESRNYGMGTVGELKEAERLSEFVERVKQVCNIPAVRYTGAPRARIRRVAILCGSGGNFLQDAIGSGADAFITGDVRYHTFREARGAIALIDAGHAETERFVAGELAGIVRGVLGSQNYSHICVLQSIKNTNPIIYA